MRIDQAARRFELERSAPGAVDFDRAFVGVQTAPGREATNEASRPARASSCGVAGQH